MTSDLQVDVVDCREQMQDTAVIDSVSDINRIFAILDELEDILQDVVM